MYAMLPTSKPSKAQRRDTDRLVDAGSQESVEAAIASAQWRQPTNLENEKVPVRPARPRRILYGSVGIGNKYSGHRKSMDPHPGTCLRLYGLVNAREPTTRWVQSVERMPADQLVLGSNIYKPVYLFIKAWRLHILLGLESPALDCMGWKSGGVE